MEKLQQLIQDESGHLKNQDGTALRYETRVGPLTTITVKHPVLDISSIVDDLADKNSAIIPRGANAYVASDFNCDTQFIKEDKAYSVYALQFYHIFHK